jgi:hypothetical protein
MNLLRPYPNLLIYSQPSGLQIVLTYALKVICPYSSVSDPYSLNPDPCILLNTDPDQACCWIYGSSPDPATDQDLL